MKKNQFSILLAGMILIVFMITNPSIEDHRQEVLENYDQYTALVKSNTSKNEWSDAAQFIGLTFGKTILEKMIKRDNYYVFSITKLTFQEKSRTIGFGFFGKVFLKDYASIKRSIAYEKKMADQKIYDKWTGRYDCNIDDLYLRGIPGVCIIPGETIDIQKINDQLTFKIKYFQSAEKTYDLVYTLSETEPFDEAVATFEVREFDNNIDQDLRKINITKRGDKYYFKVVCEFDCPDDYEYMKK